MNSHLGFFVSDEKKIIIIGCGAGGGTAAQFARKTNRNATITIFEQENYPQYSRCGLPYVIAGDIHDFTDLIEFSKEWFQKEHINLHLETTVTEIDLHKHKVEAQNKTDIIQAEFDTIILATGATSTIPPIENIWDAGKLLDGIYILRSIDHGKKINQCIEKGKNATIIGAGLIGLEMADALEKKGMNVTVVEALPSILPTTLDQDISEIVHEHLKNKINIYTNYSATTVEATNGRINNVFIKEKQTQTEKNLETDMLIIATGTNPHVELAKQIGCTLGPNGGIKVSEKAETSIKNVYAAGDCTEYLDFVTKKPVNIGLGSIAVRQAIAAGINAAGGTYKLPKGVLFTRTSKFFELEIAAVGPIKNDFQNKSIITGKYKGSSLPDYFPGGESIIMKVGIEEETGKIVYAQAVGSNVAQRINVFACAVFNEMNIDDFRKIETAYAPPVAPTLDSLTLASEAAFRKSVGKRR